MTDVSKEQFIRDTNAAWITEKNAFDMIHSIITTKLKYVAEELDHPGSTS